MIRNNLYQSQITVSAGNGGNGIVSFHRAKFVPKGGPNGGNGGNGGNVYLKSNPHMSTLIDFKYKRLFSAQNGHKGGANNRTGANGNDIYIEIPVGTEIWINNELICDFHSDNMSIQICKGGKGGIGNKAFATAESRAPAFATNGEPGETAIITLLLKYIADIGLVGMPNVGKSSFLQSAVPNANVVIGDYAFSTIKPTLGTVPDNGIVIADIPGLIEGAHEGRGKGYDFLQHIERCKVLLFMFDSSSKTLSQDITTIFNEISLYDSALLQKQIYLCFTKIDLVGGQLSPIIYDICNKHNLPILCVDNNDEQSVYNVLNNILDNVN